MTELLLEQRTSRRLLRGMAELAKAKERLLGLAKEVRVGCQHEIVYECAWESLRALGGSLSARRICPCCRLEEEGSHWSGGETWSRHDHGKSELGNRPGRQVVRIGRDELYSMRLPVGPVCAEG